MTCNRAEQFTTHLQLLENNGVFWFFVEAHDPPIDAALHDPEFSDLLSMDRFGGEGDVGARLNVLMEQCAKIHPVKLIAAENEVVIERALEEIAHVLPHGVRRSLIPLRTFRSLLRRQDVDKAARKIIELVAGLNMSM